MDTEMLAQIQEMIETATGTLRQDFRSLQQDFRSLQQDFGSLRQEVGTLGQDVGTLRLDFGSLRQEVGSVRQEISGLAQDLREGIAEGKRHTGVLVQGLRHELQLVAEGLQMHVEQRHQEDRRYMDHQFRETRALIHLSYGQLNERIEGLEVRVQSLEQRQAGHPPS
jgi:chromosome segregation ATPase